MSHITTEKSQQEGYFNKGEHWVWLSASMVSISIILVIGLLIMISARGLIHFWPYQVHEIQVQNDQGVTGTLIGELHDQQMKPVTNPDGSIEEKLQYLFKIGNRDLNGMDFVWVGADKIETPQPFPVADDILVFERTEWGNAYGHLLAIEQKDQTLEGQVALKTLPHLLEKAQELLDQVHFIEKVEIGEINYQLEGLRLEQRKLELEQALTPEKLAEIERETTELKAAYEVIKTRLQGVYQQQVDLGQLKIMTANGQTNVIPFKILVDYWQPNEMSLSQQIGFFFHRIGAFLTEEPREANTEGGVFPAIVGTITMVLLMTVLVTPLGVVAAVYMSEYAKDGVVLRFVRVSINNLAGVPSIVYGIFGLGFFVYILGGSIDELFYPYALPSPTFGSPALIWASLTMALLTLPVVIVSTQEGLSRIPANLREGGLALGATKAEVVFKIILPMSIPAIMTGLILAVARAAGEVAPLMLVGAVKLAPQLPIDGNAPFIHLDQKFMHLGFHIYDVGFQSPNVEASQPLVYATSLLLVLIIVSLNLAAIVIRNRLRENYKALSH